jgi:hypothetical protein
MNAPRFLLLIAAACVPQAAREQTGMSKPGQFTESGPETDIAMNYEGLVEPSGASTAAQKPKLRLCLDS